MNFKEFSELVNRIAIGKHLPEAIYLHKEAIPLLPEELFSFTERVNELLKIDPDKWTLLKLYKRDFKYSLLHYPEFFTDSYPSLHHSFSIDLTRKAVREANYSDSENPPILHRKETFLPPGHRLIPLFSEITQEGEAIGLYENTRTIGFKQSWQNLIARRGYQLEEGRLVPRDQPEFKPKSEREITDVTIDRHKTALSRDKLSVPVHLLAKRGYCSDDYSFLDYGCGKGDDVRELSAHGIDVIGWDPVYRPEIELAARDIVNLGFVINVIEDREERVATLKHANSLAEKILCISAMLGSDSHIAQFRPYKDGVVTSRNTFQKYYTQEELKEFIRMSLGKEPIAAGPGIFLVFNDEIEEQNYLLSRQRVRHIWRQLSARPKVEALKHIKRGVVEKHISLFEEFWQTLLDLGRIPGSDEFEHLDLIRHAAGSLPVAVELAIAYFGEEQFRFAERKRTDDLLVYFALDYFGKRSVYSRMPESLQRDVKCFFGSYIDARKEASALLHAIADPSLIFQSCVLAEKELTASYLDRDHSLTVHKKFLNELPKELRVYVGCAAQLYGEVDEIDLIKIHIRSGKVTFMRYDHFEDSPLPLLRERIKINLRYQKIDFFDYGYGDFQPQPLYWKSRYLDDSFQDYAKQKSFDKQLESFGIVEGYGLALSELKLRLNQKSLEIKGYRFFKAKER